MAFGQFFCITFFPPYYLFLLPLYRQRSFEGRKHTIHSASALFFAHSKDNYTVASIEIQCDSCVSYDGFGVHREDLLSVSLSSI